MSCGPYPNLEKRRSQLRKRCFFRYVSVAKFLGFFLVMSLSSYPALAVDFPNTLIPENLKTIRILTSTIDDVKKNLGEPKIIEESTGLTFLRYNTMGVDYDTLISIRSNKVESITLNPYQGSLQYSDFKEIFTEQELVEATQDMRKQTDHMAGSRFTITSQQHGLSATFISRGKQQLRGFTLRARGK